MKTRRVLLCTMALSACFGPRAAFGFQDLEERITFTGEIRVRSEVDARTAGSSVDQAALLRTRFGALITLAEEARAFVQFSDSRALGEETSTLTDASADRFDLHQAYLEWLPADALRIRVGRQELAFADERFVGPVGWANVTRTFDGVRGTASAGPWEVDAFAAVLDEQDALLATGLDPRQNVDGGADRLLFGAWAATAAVDVFVIGDQNATDGPVFDLTDVDRWTVGGYARRGWGPVRVTGTAALQLGEQTLALANRQDIAAFFLSGAATYEFPGTGAPTAGLRFDVVSGDDTPTDGTFSAFNTLYATNHPYYGYMDFFLNVPQQTGGLGLLDLVGRGSVAPGSWTFRADLHHLWLAREAPTGERALGLELDLTARRPLTAGFVAQAGYSLFSPSAGAELPAVGLGDEVLHWVYVQGTMGF